MLSLIESSSALSISRNRILYSAHKIAISTDKCIELYEDSKRRIEFQKSVTKLNADSECSFKPNIKISQKRVRSRTSIKRHLCYSPFNFGELKKEKFKPMIGRPQKTLRNPQKKPIGNYLHDMANKPTKAYIKHIIEQNEYRPKKYYVHPKNNNEREKFNAYRKVIQFLNKD
jgi:hypothetical protein